MMKIGLGRIRNGKCTFFVAPGPRQSGGMSVN